MYNSAELDTIKDKYFDEGARPSISTLIYLRDVEKKEALERIRNEAEKVRKEFADKEKLLKLFHEQERLKQVQEQKEALPYSDALAQEICERIAVDELLINVCTDERLPTMRRCNQWLRDNPDFNALYTSAISDRLSVFEEEVIQIADDMSRDFRTVIKNSVERRVPDPEQVARAKLRIEVRFKHLKAGRPSKWGDVSTLITKNDDPFDTSNLSPEELERQIADIEQKSRVRKVA
jgi:hypothetical protein